MNGLVLCLDAANIKGYDKYENLTLQTSQIGLTPTYSVSGIVGLNTTATTAPNGLYEASLVDNNGNTSTNYVYGSAGLTTNTTYTYSIYIKQGTKPDFWITIDENGFGGKRYYSSFTYSNESVTTGITGNTGNDGALIGSSASKLTNGWYRLSLVFKTSTTAVSTFVDMINRFGNTSGSNYVWGRQLEIGDTTTDYYATTSTVKNRGTICNDLSGNANTGTLTNGVRYSNSNSGSFVLDGVDDYLINSSTTNIPTGSSSRTIQLWVYLKSDTNTFVQLGTGGGGNQVYILQFYNIGGTRYLFTDGVNGANNLTISVSQLPILNIWNHIIFGNSGQNWFYYLNGVSQASGTFGVTLNTIGQKYIIGKRDDYLPTPGNINGNIAQVSIYNRALTEAEIQQNYNALKSRFVIPSIVTDGLVLNLDAGNTNSYPGSGTTWTDLSGEGNTGTLTNGPTFSSANSGSIVFDGANDYVQKSSATINLSAGVTMEMIFKSTDMNSRAQGFMQFNTGGNYINFYTSGNGRLRWETWVPVGVAGGAYTTPTALSNNTWYHAVGTYTNGSSVLYINGVSVASASQTPGTYSSSYTANIVIGEYAGYMSGNVAIARIYNRALTAAEIRQNFNALRGRFGI